MNPTQAITTAMMLSLWGLTIIVGYFVLGAVLELGWPYWAFGWILALFLLLLPQGIYSSFLRAEYRNQGRRGAMRRVHAERG